MLKKGIQLDNRKLVNTILYADDQILTATSEDELQTMAYHLNLIENYVYVHLYCYINKMV